jgi:hypothetical protein
MSVFVQSTANATAVVTLTTNNLIERSIKQIVYSYSGTPTAGSIKIEDGAGNTIGFWYITSGGPGVLPFNDGFHGTLANNLIITLAAGGSGIFGTMLVI